MRLPYVYISHPYTDDTITQEKANRSSSIEDSIEALTKDVIPINPLTVFGFLTPKQLEAHRDIDIGRSEIMTACFELLKMADAIYLPDGWQDSKGCRKEARLAKHLGKTIIRGEDALDRYANRFSGDNDV